MREFDQREASISTIVKLNFLVTKYILQRLNGFFTSTISLEVIHSIHFQTCAHGPWK